MFTKYYVSSTTLKW